MTAPRNLNRNVSEVDREKMEEVTEKGIEQGFENAHEEWRAMALDCLHKVCLSYDTFTVNDVRALVERSPLKTHDNRAMGGIIKTGQRRVACSNRRKHSECGRSQGSHSNLEVLNLQSNEKCS